MKLDQVYERFILSMDGVLSPKTISWYNTKLKPLLTTYGDLDIEIIEIDHLRRLRGELSNRTVLYQDCDYRKPIEGTLSSATIRAHIRAMRRLFNWSIEENYIEENPSKRLRMPPKKKGPRKGISDPDRLAMLHVTENKIRNHAILWFVWETACRRGGVVGLTFDDLYLDDGEAIVYEKGKSRIVYFDEEAIPLRNYLEIHPGGTHIFMGKDGPLQHSGINSVFTKAAEAAGVTEKYSPHQWRHARSRFWLKNGMPLKVVSQLLGHSDIHVTAEHYGDLAQSELKEAHKKYS